MQINTSQVRPSLSVLPMRGITWSRSIRVAKMNKPDKAYSVKHTLMPTLSLFTSLGTLVCCALPALLVTLGAGAALAGLVSAAPWLVALSKYKAWTFGVSGGMIVLAGIMRWHARNAPCPIDPKQAKACTRLRRVSAWFYWGSVLVWCVGFFFAFIAVRIFYGT